MTSSSWADLSKWEEAWETEKELTGGGQGSAKQVRKLTDGTKAFLKILSRQNDEERRARFFREATAYDTSNHPGIPRLVQSNAHMHANRGNKLYIATELINGGTLADYVDTYGPMSLQEAVGMLQGILSTLAYLHREDRVHRDVKPDNIMLRDGNVNAPVLVDFGLSYRLEDDVQYTTEEGQEIGNRFLRLPELSSGSANKRDPRSDLSFAGGLLFYALTGAAPSTVIDEDARMPHQRMAFNDNLRAVSGPAFLALQDFFDRALTPKLSDRFASAEEMTESAGRLTLVEKTSHRNFENELASMVSRVNNQATLRLLERKRLMDLAMGEISKIHREFLSRFGGTFGNYQTGAESTENGIRNIVGVWHAVSREVIFAPRLSVSIKGEELIISADDKPVYRTDADQPKFDEYPSGGGRLGIGG